MELVRDKETEGKFRFDQVPSESQAPIIRKVLGLNKAPTVTTERKLALQNHAREIREAAIAH